MNYYLFGSPIRHSLSPLIHNTGFQHCGMDKTYDLFETLDIDLVVRILRDAETGGGSITIPHKESILPFLDDITPAARQIGAVNTILKKDQTLVGANTDYLGIMRPIQRTKKIYKSAFVLGAGGAARATCYALQQLGIPFEIYNRTASKADRLALEFGGRRIDDVLAHQGALVINTLPPVVKLDLAASFWASVITVFDIVYKPYMTPLLAMAQARGVRTIHGIDMLLEQAYEQFYLWTAVDYPSEVITSLIAAELESKTL